ncbi:LysR family transcriptional regulator [Levilactobacillus acidifarinae]|uniref:HTH lysR-type domain-containing protein n=1 Tax=Levilactobacillus acidifarinae DSM 19394 = JCM 15949 TaxID=1423715 RepID=A0A0R1LQB7_9LACO|nr:LysR family transcriptional regulator [Levilactobacillus acidifarinae]KRK94426.1 hypothetical protein FD25_GL000386 [Levilactobacillus acidifarinae DSM 19394]GEO68166.1 LysR family transcriptional regulator [Levilactobacillus acidifarinae]
METKHLQYFLKIIQEGSLSSAANKLHMSQPTLSRQLKSLEEELNTTLFIRGHRELILTKSGKIFQRKAEQLLKILDQTKSEIQQTDTTELVGTITIGCTQTNVAKFMSKVIALFKNEHPSVKFNIYDLSVKDIKSYLDDGMLDIGFIMNPSDTDRFNVIQLDMVDNWGIIVPNYSQFSNKSSFEIKDIQKLPLLIPQNLVIQLDLLNQMKLKANLMNVVGTQNLVTNSLNLCRQGTADILCTSGALPENIADLKFIPIKSLPDISHSVIWKKGISQESATKKFLSLIKHNSNLATPQSEI